jgi:hypothetical protein
MHPIKEGALSSSSLTTAEDSSSTKLKINPAQQNLISNSNDSTATKGGEGIGPILQKVCNHENNSK